MIIRVTMALFYTAEAKMAQYGDPLAVERLLSRMRARDAEQAKRKETTHGRQPHAQPRKVTGQSK